MKRCIDTRRKMRHELIASPQTNQLAYIAARATGETGDRSRAKASPISGKQTATMPMRATVGVTNS